MSATKGSGDQKDKRVRDWQISASGWPDDATLHSCKTLGERDGRSLVYYTGDKVVETQTMDEWKSVLDRKSGV